MINITYSEAIEQQKALREQKAGLAKEHLSAAAKAIFEKYPTLIAFLWRQYTPYFNDGEECTFSVYDDYSMKFDGMEEFLDTYEFDGEPEELAKEVEEAIKAGFKIVEEEDYKTVFGDHIEVTADREGFHVEEYSHD